jgi:hypothetical protein
VFENRKLRKTFEPNKDGVTGKWRRLLKRSFWNYMPHQQLIGRSDTRTMRWVGHVTWRLHRVLVE